MIIIEKCCSSEILFSQLTILFLIPGVPLIIKIPGEVCDGGDSSKSWKKKKTKKHTELWLISHGFKW